MLSSKNNKNRKSTNLVQVPMGRRSVLGASAMLLLPSIASAMPQASAMRIHDHGTFTRLVVELSESIEAASIKWSSNSA